MKKKYNPFKMWGSYVGAGIFFIIGFFPFVSMAFAQNTIGKILPVFWNHPQTSNIGLIELVILGFLLGWGIQSLIRRK